MVRRLFCTPLGCSTASPRSRGKQLMAGDIWGTRITHLGMIRKLSECSRKGAVRSNAPRVAPWAEPRKKDSIPESSRLRLPPSAGRSRARIWLVVVSIISRPTASACAIRSFTPKACALPAALSRPDAKWPLARVSNAPVCTGPNKAPTPSLLSAAQNSVVVFKTSGSAGQSAAPHDHHFLGVHPSLSGLSF